MLKTAHFLQELEFFQVNCHFPREKACCRCSSHSTRTPSHIIPASRQLRNLHCCNVTSLFLWQPPKKTVLSLTIVLPLTVLPGFPAVLPVVPVGAACTRWPRYRETTIRLTESAHKCFKSSMWEFPKVQYLKYFHCTGNLIFLIFCSS